MRIRHSVSIGANGWKKTGEPHSECRAQRLDNGVANLRRDPFAEDDGHYDN